MPNNISTVHCKLVGLCNLKGEVRDQVLREWNARFHEHDAFWVDVEDGQNEIDIAKAVTKKIREQGITAMANQKVVIAAFLDLENAPDESIVKEIIKVPVRLHGALGCTVQLTMEFGNLGEMAFADKKKLREHAQRIVAVNHGDKDNYEYLCLISTSPLVCPKDDASWKAVMLALDVLRRNASPESLIHGGNVDGDIGFIRYGEYDEEKQTVLTAEKTRLERALSNDGEQRLRDVFGNALDLIRQETEAKYTVIGKLQPIHPDMIVTGAFRRMAARNGHLDSYENAKNSTWSAVESTGKMIGKMIAEDYAHQIDNAGQYLKKYIEEAGVGIQVEENRDLMKDILKVQITGVNKPQAPALRYKEEGCSTEIEEYLLGVRRYEAAQTKVSFANAVREAYLQIPDVEFAERKSQMNAELANLNTRLGNVLSKQNMLSLLANDRQLPHVTFFPILGGGGTMSWAVCTDVGIGREMDNCVPPGVNAYYISPTGGTLKTQDSVPIKAVQIVLSNCDTAHLEDLIK